MTQLMTLTKIIGIILLNEERQKCPVANCRLYANYMRTIQTSKQLDLFKQTTAPISFNHISNKTSDQSTDPTCKRKDGNALQQIRPLAAFASLCCTMALQSSQRPSEHFDVSSNVEKVLIGHVHVFLSLRIYDVRVTTQWHLVKIPSFETKHDQ